ncbi:MAG: LCP family protein [Clostridia bacterium]|nr:LCP family protein [Clostridia bacterium]
MNNRYQRKRRRRLRVTGRFYAFLTVVVVLCVLVGVMITNRNARPSSTFTPTSNIVQSTGVVIPSVTLSPELSDSVNVVAANPVTTSTTSASTVDGSDGTSTAANAVTTVAQTTTTTTTSATGSVESIDDLIDANPDLEALVSSETVDTSALAVTEGLPSEWRNILLLGSDTRNLNNVSRTDTIIIASINVNDGRVKLVSIMRDLVVPITQKNGKQRTAKINSASYYGGIELTIKTVNELFGMNITEYVLVNFASFQKVIDILGGVKIDITQAEMEQVNESLGQHARIAGYDQQWYLENKESLMLKTFGPDTLLTGIQALGYARIRHVGAGDYERVNRQRTLLNSVLKGVKDNASAIQIMQIATSMWGEIKTNINMLSAVGIATTVIKNGASQVDMDGRIPGKGTFVSETRNGTSALYDCDFEANKQLLYTFIYEK